MWRNARALLTALACILTTACQSLTGIIGTDPKPARSEVVRLLCTRSADGGMYVFGPIYISRKDVLTDETLAYLGAHAAAWEAATDKGALCTALGGEDFGKIKWGTPSAEKVP